MTFSPETRTSLDVVQFLARENPSIESFTLCSYDTPPRQRTVKEAGDLLNTLLRHKENDDFPPTPARDITTHALARMCDALPPNRCLAFRSKARSRYGEDLLFPLFDFSLPTKTANSLKITALKDLILKIHQIHQYKGRAFLLKTTKSYHYYGTYPLQEKQWLSFLGLFLLLHPKNEHCKASIRMGFSTIIDARFIGHVLLAGQGSLRISAGPKIGFPKVVAEIKTTKPDGSHV